MPLALVSDQSRDVRDAEDGLLLETGDHAALLAAYYPVIRQRCLLGVRGDVADDVAQDVCVRLAAELRRGKRYHVPYRVVVHQFVRWTIMEHRAGIPTDLPIPSGWDPASPDDPFAAFEADYDIDQLFHDLPEGDRKVAELRYRCALEIDEIAARLGKERNAIDQALWRVHRKLWTLLDGA
jgi:DNA-directed RNA polymerase specialized sigma24 family protein